MPLESRQDSLMEYRRVACERCGGETSFTAQVSPLGNEPGVRIYHCPACTCFTVIEWGGLRPETHPHAERMPSVIPSPVEPARQRTQQHRQKDDDSGR
jgi:hypothetical protein